MFALYYDYISESSGKNCHIKILLFCMKSLIRQKGDLGITYNKCIFFIDYEISCRIVFQHLTGHFCCLNKQKINQKYNRP